MADDARPADTGTTDSGGTADARGGADAKQPPITIWLAGDSTVQDYPAGNIEGNNGTTLEGWGQELAPFFNTRVVVDNQAIGGRSVAFFMWAVQRDAAGNYLCVDDQGNPNYQLDATGNHVDTAQWARIKAGIKPGDFLLAQFGTNDETHSLHQAGRDQGGGARHRRDPHAQGPAGGILEIAPSISQGLSRQQLRTRDGSLARA